MTEEQKLTFTIGSKSFDLTKKDLEAMLRVFEEHKASGGAMTPTLEQYESLVRRTLNVFNT